MIHLTRADINPFMRTYNLDEVIDKDDFILDTAEAYAIQTVKDHTYALYDIAAMLALTGTSRHPTIVRLLVSLVMYHIHQRLADIMIPDMVVKNYDEAMKLLRDIAAGDIGLQGAVLLTDTESDGSTTPKTAFRWGSNTKRSY